MFLHVQPYFSIFQNFSKRYPPHSTFDGKAFLLLPANEVWDKVMFLHLSVILFTGGGTMQGVP